MLEKIKNKILSNMFDSKERFIGKKKLNLILDKDEIKYFESKFDSRFTEKEKIYLFLNNLESKDGICICGNKKRFINMKQGFALYCGIKCKYKIQKVQEKAKQTMIKKYGVENPTYLKQTKENHWSKSKEKDNIALKISKTKINKSKKYKDKIYEKYKNTNLKKYGVENVFQDSEIKEKIKQTNLKKYGVENPMQNSKIFEKQRKNSFKLKKFIFSSGKEIKLQGFEPEALEILLKQYDKNDIITSISKIPKIKYKLNDKIHVYFPDFYIKSKNKIIEVKSIYTFLKDKEKNLKKKEACLANNFDFEFMIFDRKKKLINEAILIN